MPKTQATLYQKLHHKAVLKSAARVVLAKALHSSNPEIREEAEAFMSAQTKRINNISKKLKEKSYHFSKSRGVPIPRPGKDRRPIVVSPLEDRIIRRAILEILQKQDFIKPYLSLPTSFGGVSRPNKEKRTSFNGGVPEAIQKTVDTICGGASYYVRSDIRDFFRHIPSQVVLDKLKPHLDKDFFDFLSRAVKVELENQHHISKYKHLFPTSEKGVAQGCSLSPLLGNILLYNFDLELNKQGVTCLRYIDDFIVFAKSKKQAEFYFKKGLQLLKGLDLTAHDDFDKSNGKAKAGQIKDGVNFLGINITGKTIQPDKNARKKLLENINSTLKESIDNEFGRKLDKAGNYTYKIYSYLKTLDRVSRKIEGWGNQYKFCNNKVAMQSLDARINAYLSDYKQQYHFYYQQLKKHEDRMRVSGFKMLIDCKHEPIKWNTSSA